MSRISPTIIWDRVWSRAQAVKVVSAISISLELSAQVEFDLVGILLLIQAIGGRLPHFDSRADKRLLSSKVYDATMHVGHLAVFGLSDDNVGTVVAVRGIRAEEWAQDGGGGRRIFSFVGQSESNFIDQAGLKLVHVHGW